MWKRSRRSSTSLAACLISCVTLAGAAQTSGQRPAKVDPTVRLARSVLKHGDYQTELPRDLAANPPVFVLALSRLLKPALYLLLAVCLLLIAWWLMTRLGARSGSGGLELRAPPSGIGPRAPAGIELSDVERWVSLGKYQEAVHALLLIAIRRLIDPLPARPGLSRTSRELLRTLPLCDERRQALGALVRQVELSLFGGRDVDAAQYAGCRQSFDALFMGTHP
jgi:hypothetical protein